MENQIRTSQDEIWQELSTYDREDMLLRAGFPERRNKKEKEWLERHSREAETGRIASAATAHVIKESFKIMGLKN